MFGDRNSKLSVDFRGDLGEEDIDARVSGVSGGRHQGGRCDCDGLGYVIVIDLATSAVCDAWRPGQQTVEVRVQSAKVSLMFAVASFSVMMHRAAPTLDRGASGTPHPCNFELDLDLLAVPNTESQTSHFTCHSLSLQTSLYLFTTGCGAW